jgi:hypothetical protein
MRWMMWRAPRSGRPRLLGADAAGEGARADVRHLALSVHPAIRCRLLPLGTRAYCSPLIKAISNHRVLS